MGMIRLNRSSCSSTPVTYERRSQTSRGISRQDVVLTASTHCDFENKAAKTHQNTPEPSTRRFHSTVELLRFVCSYVSGDRNVCDAYLGAVEVVLGAKRLAELVLMRLVHRRQADK